MGKKTDVIQYEDLRTRMRALLLRIKDIAEELETNDMTLVCHLLILDSLHYGKKKHFEGVDIHRAKI